MKLVDFGSAVYQYAWHATVVSTRHYRAPEIILRLGWSFPCDVWSMGCILYEMYTGEVLFGLLEEADHLAMIQKVVGPLPPAQVRLPLSLYSRLSTSSFSSLCRLSLARPSPRARHSYMPRMPVHRLNSLLLPLPPSITLPPQHYLPPMHVSASLLLLLNVKVPIRGLARNRQANYRPRLKQVQQAVAAGVDPKLFTEEGAQAWPTEAATDAALQAVQKARPLAEVVHDVTLLDLMTKMLLLSATDRLTASQALQHPFFQ